ncbi:MAG TPA: DapH/DapD/GlmU-related protein [Anaerolineales bacterium]|nr:DapH/DapD/GlmU-related protein [Anaerolineales bacterium]
MSSISAHSIIYPNVQLGADSRVGDFAILGEAPRGALPGELQTLIGPGAVIRSHTVIYAGNQIGGGFETGHGVMVRELNRIGDHVSIGTHSIVEHHVVLGDNVRIHSGVFIPEYCVLEDDCWVGPAVILTNANYPLSPGVKDRLQGALIRRGAKIGAGAVLLPGITIGRNALVGAGAVVVRDVEENAVVAGNPARLIKRLTDIPEYQSKE